MKQTKCVVVEEKTHEKLMLLKIKKKHKSIDETITSLLRKESVASRKKVSC